MKAAILCMGPEFQNLPNAKLRLGRRFMENTRLSIDEGLKAWRDLAKIWQSCVRNLLRHGTSRAEHIY